MLRSAALRFRTESTRRLKPISRCPFITPLSTISTGKQRHEIRTFNTNKCLSSRLITGDHGQIPDIDRPFKKILTANRGEIATRVMRACSELGVATAGIYSHEDRLTQHRYKADQAFMLSSKKVC